MPQAHRHGDLRICGATTIVTGQSSVKVNGKLWSVENDPNTHGAGELIPTGTTVFVEGKPVIVHTADHALPDDLCWIIGEPHCDPETAQGSPDVYAYGGPGTPIFVTPEPPGGWPRDDPNPTPP